MVSHRKNISKDVSADARAVGNARIEGLTDDLHMSEFGLRKTRYLMKCIGQLTFASWT